MKPGRALAAKHTTRAEEIRGRGEVGKGRGREQLSRSEGGTGEPGTLSIILCICETFLLGVVVRVCNHSFRLQFERCRQMKRDSSPKSALHSSHHSHQGSQRHALGLRMW